MTAEKLILIFMAVAVFILCISIFLKSAQGQKTHLFWSVMGSMTLGASGLGAVMVAELFCGKLITLNLCTVLISLLGSLPAVAAMLFINVI